MSIVIHLPEVDDPAVPAYEPSVSRLRHGGGPIDMTEPSADLLPTGGAPTRDLAPASLRTLALDALASLTDVEGRDGPWSDPTFQIAVEVVRRQIMPLRSRVTLADSYAREGCHRASSAGHGVTPVHVAYALRWLELGRPRSTVRAPAPGRSARP